MKEDGSQVYWEKDGRSLATSPLSRYNLNMGGGPAGQGGTSLKLRDEKQRIPNQNRYNIDITKTLTPLKGTVSEISSYHPRKDGNAFKVTVVNRALPSSNEESLEITLTVPFRILILSFKSLELKPCLI